MLAIEVEFLMGRATISRWDDRTESEWPPHPQRLFSSLVAAHSELDAGGRSEAALRWLETLAPPQIKADLSPSLRTSPSYFVPVNDETAKVEKGKTDFRHVLERRNRQERYFPAVVPKDPVVVFQWLETPGIDEHRDALKMLVENMTYLGHSSSPVRACLRSEHVVPSLCPADDGDLSLRIPGAGRFDRLRSVHELRTDDESVQPPLGRTQPYAVPGAVPQSVFSPRALVVAFENGPKLGLDSSLPLMQHLRNAVLSRLGSAVPEVISGHDAAGKMSSSPHLSFVPLGFVNSKYADGSLKGAALVPPLGVPEQVWSKLRSALLGAWQLHLGPLGTIWIRLVERPSDELTSLAFSVYTKPSDAWASVTPVVLDRHPKKNGLSLEAIIVNACARIGLPEPVDVRTGSVSAVPGAPAVQQFRGRSKQVDSRMRKHVLIRFDRPVRGPVLIGAGRFIGLGLCLPFKAGKP